MWMDHDQVGEQYYLTLYCFAQVCFIVNFYFSWLLMPLSWKCYNVKIVCYFFKLFEIEGCVLCCVLFSICIVPSNGSTFSVFSAFCDWKCRRMMTIASVTTCGFFCRSPTMITFRQYLELINVHSNWRTNECWPTLWVRQYTNGHHCGNPLVSFASSLLFVLFFFFCCVP